MPPKNPIVLHYYDSPAEGGYGIFVCPIGHRFRCKLTTANACAQRYGAIWAISSCTACLPVLVLANSQPLLPFLRDHALFPPDTEPRPLYHCLL